MIDGNKKEINETICYVQQTSFSILQQEMIVLMKMLDLLRTNGTQLDKLWVDVNFEAKFISPLLISTLVNTIKIEDENFCKIIRILQRSISGLSEDFFPGIDAHLLSEEFSRTFGKINNIIENIWV